ncbi:MAG TPA: ATP-binding protein [Thermoanaerobaculia bacterium]|jgi:signal transduction histidine kinase|nr:ATP-binding protein [Thermoanaerobaculia bacterium]
MERAAPSSSSRNLLIVSLVFGLFVLLNIALFGWLIFRSLSQREIDRVLLETRSEAEKLAQQIARRADREGKDLYTAVAVERETQTYIDQVLRQRELVRRVEIRDKNGVLVYVARSEARMPVEAEPERRPPTIAPPIVSSPELQQSLEPSPHVEKRVRETESSFQVPDIHVPIGNYGQIEIAISGPELSRRIEVLRKDLIRQASLIGILSMLLLISAYITVWLVLRRSHRLEVQAAEAERLAYLGTLASGLAHEIRNPLNSLNLNMQMLEEELDEHGSAPTGKRLLAITRSELSRLERLVSDFLAYAKPRPLELEEVPAVRPLERMREVLAGEIQKRQVQIEIEDRSGGAWIRVDPGQMGQLLLNLAQNAFAAAEEAGRRPMLKLAAYRQGPAVALELTDNGIGMTAEEQRKIFELFYSTRKGGTGLGLAIAERIARAHGGRLGIRSAKGLGTTVIVELPAATSEHPSTRAAVEAAANA